METGKIMTRSEVDEKYKWAIEDLYANDEQWQEEYEVLEKSIEKCDSYKGKLSESAEVLSEYLEVYTEAAKLLERVHVYSNQKSHEDLGNSKYQSLAGKSQTLMVKFGGANSFFEPEILEMDEDKLKEFIRENELLKKCEKVFTDILRKKEHILNKEIEEILANTEEIASGPRDIFTLFNNADLKFGEVKDDEGELKELTHGRYSQFLESDNQQVRKDAFKAMYLSYGNFKNTIAAIYGASVKKDAFFAKTRKYESSLASALSGSNIPVSVYDNLLDTVGKNLPVLHEYIKVRKEALGLDELHMYDLYTPIVKDVKVKIPYEQAKEKVKEGLAPMGEEYIKVLLEGYNNGWIDVYENQGKRSGAYSWGAYGTHPYVLLNYNDTLNNVFTLAHEMGHALHSYYSDKTQPYIFAGYQIFVAEVASTCNESLLIHHMIKNTEDKKQKAYLINYFLEQFRTTLFRQTMFAEFEKISHEMVEQGETLTAENLSEKYYELNKKYFGDEIVIDEEIALEWARIPHFYSSFYVYQYATGFSAAIALSKKIMSQGESAVKDYMKFLTGGSSKDPIDLLKDAGIDMSSPEPVEKAMEIFKELLDEFKDLI